ncbi:hypothetical protein [Streptosporangium jomthongense]|uniref:Uncharacterized protein n=1 Tax=Streptosporangium jomthongense TaxID=1193683 RepID=A0ABV8ETW9_9ACTN
MVIFDRPSGVAMFQTSIEESGLEDRADAPRAENHSPQRLEDGLDQGIGAFGVAWAPQVTWLKVR